MSRIGHTPIAISKDAKVTPSGPTVSVKGPKGTLSMNLDPSISVTIEGDAVHVKRSSNDKATKALHGLFRAKLANMVQGVTEGFTRELEIVGVGYRAALQGKTLVLSTGFSHDVTLPIPEGLTVEVPKPTAVSVKGIDKQLVGQFAANLHRVAPPEPYKGKGVKYAGEHIRRKAGKAATGSGAKAG